MDRKISPELIEKYWAQISQAGSKATAKRKMASLRRFLDWAQSQGYVESQLKEDLEPLKSMPEPQKRLPRWLNIGNLLRSGVLIGLVILLVILGKRIRLSIPFWSAPTGNQAGEISQVPSEKVTLAEAKEEIFKEIRSIINWASLESGNLLIGGAPVSSIVLSTGDNSDGDITLNPDGAGKLNLIFEGQKGNLVNATTANLSSGSLYYGYISNNALNPYLISLESGTTPNPKFSVRATGETTINGSLNLAGDLQFGGLAKLTQAGKLDFISGYYQTSGKFEIDQGTPDFVGITKDLSGTEGAATKDSVILSFSEVASSGYDTLVLKRTGGTSEANALFVDSGNVLFNDNTTLGSSSSDTMVFNASTLSVPNNLNIDSSTLYIDAANNRVGIGTAPSYQFEQAGTLTDTASATIYGALKTITLNPASASSTLFHGDRISMETAATAINYNTIIALAPRVFHNGTGTITDARGNNLVLANNSTGTITLGIGGRFETRNDTSGGTITDARAGHFIIQNSGAASTMTTAYGALIDYSANEGTITTGYGLYINDVLATTDYGIYQAGTSDFNYFAGDTGIGTTTPDRDLEVEDTSGAFIRVTDDNSTNSYLEITGGNQGSFFPFINTGSGWSRLDIGTQGNRFLTLSSSKIGIGTNSPDAKLHLTGAVVGKALAIFNETGDQNIFTASTSGVTKFTIQNSGLVDATTDGSSTKVVAGAITDGSFTGTAVNGLLGVDSTNGRFYFRYGGAWHYVAQTAGFQIPNHETFSYDFDSQSFDQERPLDNGDFLIPFVEKRLSDGAVHGLYTRFSDVKDDLLAKIKSTFIQIGILSPLPGKSEIAIQIGNEDKNDLGKLSIKDSSKKEVASIDEAGNATFSGVVRAQNIEAIEETLKKVNEEQKLLFEAQNWGVKTANETITAGNLLVTGTAAASNLSLLESLAIGGDLILESNNSINTIISPLRLQSLGLSPIELMAGLIRIDTAGNMELDANLYVKGNAQIKGGVEAGSLTTNQIIIAHPGEATASGEVSSGNIETNATAGKAVILQGESELTIKNPKISEATLVYVTPTSSTQNNVLFVKSKGEGFFKVGFIDPISLDVEFNWWVIETR